MGWTVDRIGHFKCLRFFSCSWTFFNLQKKGRRKRNLQQSFLLCLCKVALNAACPVYFISYVHMDALYQKIIYILIWQCVCVFISGRCWIQGARLGRRRSGWARSGYFDEKYQLLPRPQPCVHYPMETHAVWNRRWKVRCPPFELLLPSFFILCCSLIKQIERKGWLLPSTYASNESRNGRCEMNE